MNISEHLKKKYWRRRVYGDLPTELPTKSEYYYNDYINEDNVTYRLMTQEDLLREIEPSAHDINSKYMSTRPIKEARTKLDENGNPVLDENGKPIREWIITGYDDMETVRCGLQRRFALVKASHFAADGFWISNESKNNNERNHSLFDTLNSWKDSAGLNTALMEIANSCFQSGDAGIYIYATPDKNIEYKVYSYLDGFTIFPDYDENRNKIYFVLYSLRGKQAVDVFLPDAIETWVSSIDANNDKTWLGRVRGWFKVGKSITVSEDGWVRVARKETQISLRQFFYFRIPDIPSGPVQEDINSYERSASFVAEGVKDTTFDTLFIKAPNIENLPAIGSHGKVIGVRGTVDELKAADAKRIAPSNISDVATIDLKTKMDNILHSTLSVVVDPDILRSGADSSSAMRLCFVSEIQWCQTMWPYFYHELKALIRSFQHLVAKVEGDDGFINLRVSVGQNIWIPANRGEQVEQTTKMLYAGIISQENARHELDLQYPDDRELVRKEAEESIWRKKYFDLKAQADAQKDFGNINAVNEPTKEDNNNNDDIDMAEQQAEDYKPKLDNNLANKDINTN